MSDALCGPSNALQQFKQQTSRDRTLQQDRLTSRHSPAQGFRSPDPNTRLLDPEFEAFQAGIVAPDLPSFQPFQPPLHPQQQHFAGSSQAPSWASDFQRMSISSPPPPQQLQHHRQAGPSVTDWATDFQRHTPQPQQHSSPSPYAFQQQARYGVGGFQSQLTHQQPNYAQNTQQSKGKEPAFEQFDEAAFERAFDQAAESAFSEVAGHDGIMANGTLSREDELLSAQNAPSMYETDTIHADETMQAALNVTEQQSSAGGFRDMDSQVIDNDVAMDQWNLPLEEQHREQEAEKTEQQRQQDDDALAATAQELLQKVEHNKSDKFRNSQFLGLMRKLADREVKVEGDKMVEATQTASASSSTNASASEHISASNFATATAGTQIPLFNNSEQRPMPVIDTRPDEYGIPHSEQDHDSARYTAADDGRAVVDLLAEQGAPGDEIGTFDIQHPQAEDLLEDFDFDTFLRDDAVGFGSDASTFDGASLDADLRPNNTVSLQDALYGPGGSLSRKLGR